MHLQRKLIFKAALLALSFAVAGCGVKGDPLPPEKPADIGRGRPTYKRATEEIKIQKKSRSTRAPIKDDSDEDDDDQE